MSRRQYYSVRTGNNPGASRYSLEMLKRLFLSVYSDLLYQELFQEFLGKDCPDDQYSYGTAGQDVGMFFLRKLKKESLWPIQQEIGNYSEADLFDVIELLHDHASAGVEGRMHNFGGCGMHFTRFDRQEGQLRFRTALNEILHDYGSGFELSESGEVVHLAEAGFESLMEAPVPHADQRNVTARIEAAVRKYRSRSSGLEERRAAVRDLIDVLEYLRPQ